MLKSRFPDLKLICFDLDDTLWPCHDTIIAAEEALFTWLQDKVPQLAAQHSMQSLRQHRRAVAEREPAIAHDMTRLRQRHLELLLLEYGYDPAIAPVATEFFQQHRNRVRPFDDVPGVLEELRQDYVLISLTNGNAQVHKTPLAGLFHHSLTAAEVGYAKPHPALFERAMYLAGVAPAQALHVGDDPVRDILPALQLGMRAIHVLRQPVTDSAVALPDDVPQIMRLDALLESGGTSSN